MRFGFSGSRSLCAAPFLPALLASLPASEKGVGDARGFDALVRAACPSARVFSPRFAGRGGLAARSAELVRWVALGGEGSVLFVAVSSPCPAGVQPSRSFRGFGSGSWGSAALAVGLGLRVVLFWCGSGSAPAFPAWVYNQQTEV